MIRCASTHRSAHARGPFERTGKKQACPGWLHTYVTLPPHGRNRFCRNGNSDTDGCVSYLLLWQNAPPEQLGKARVYFGIRLKRHGNSTMRPLLTLHPQLRNWTWGSGSKTSRPASPGTYFLPARLRILNAPQPSIMARPARGLVVRHVNP